MMMILYYDKFNDRHETFVRMLKEIKGRYFVIHATSYEDVKEALLTYDIDLASIDDSGAEEVPKFIMAMEPEERPRVVNLHSYMLATAKEMSAQFDPTIEVWEFQTYNKRFYEEIRKREQEDAEQEAAREKAAQEEVEAVENFC